MCTCVCMEMGSLKKKAGGQPSGTRVPDSQNSRNREETKAACQRQPCRVGAFRCQVIALFDFFSAPIVKSLRAIVVYDDLSTRSLSNAFFLIGHHPHQLCQSRLGSLRKADANTAGLGAFWNSNAAAKDRSWYYNVIFGAFAQRTDIFHGW